MRTEELEPRKFQIKWRKSIYTLRSVQKLNNNKKMLYHVNIKQQPSKNIQHILSIIVYLKSSTHVKILI